MKEPYTQYLKEQGYSEWTPSGNKSTVYDYPNRIENVCRWEHMTWSEVAMNITSLIQLYDIGGAKEDVGNKSNRAVINALKRYSEFLDSHGG